jgi:hypothetical protein
MTKADAAKATVPANKKKKPGSRAAKLKSSKWYEEAARSVGIAKDRSLESRDDVMKKRGRDSP